MCRDYYFKNKNGLRIKVSFTVYVGLFECYFLSEFVVSELINCYAEEVVLDCSDEFLNLLANSYLKAEPILYDLELGFSYDCE